MPPIIVHVFLRQSPVIDLVRVFLGYVYAYSIWCISVHKIAYMVLANPKYTLGQWANPGNENYGLQCVICVGWGCMCV